MSELIAFVKMYSLEITIAMAVFYLSFILLDSGFKKNRKTDKKGDKEDVHIS